MPELTARLAEVLGEVPQRLEPLSGGMIGSVYRVVLAGGEHVVAKTSDNPLGTEAAMLHYLRTHSELPVPEVRHADDELLVLESMEGESRFGTGAERHAGELLAALHRITAEAYGFETDTLIGSLRQPNPKMTDWPRFFREARLEYMARLALEAGHLPRPFTARLERVGADLDGLLEGHGPPSLLHGDVWAANVLAQGERVTAFLDPALYYGDREVELAYIDLFGTFGEAFFGRYGARYPVTEGFLERRRHVYALYPLLTHVRYFGGRYVARLDERLGRLGY